jgi:flagellar basal body-associated protein FliL
MRGTPIAVVSSMPEDKEEAATRRHRRIGPALVLPLVGLAGLGIWFWISHEPEAVRATDDAVRSTLHLETFVLNLADINQRAYLRVGIDLGLNQDAKRAAEQVPMAEVRDTILNVLSDGKVDDLMTSGGKAKLKQEILHALQERVPRLGATEVYFTEFLVQR